MLRKQRTRETRRRGSESGIRGGGRGERGNGRRRRIGEGPKGKTQSGRGTRSSPPVPSTLHLARAHTHTDTHTHTSTSPRAFPLPHDSDVPERTHRVPAASPRRRDERPTVTRDRPKADAALRPARRPDSAATPRARVAASSGRARRAGPGSTSDRSLDRPLHRHAPTIHAGSTAPRPRPDMVSASLDAGASKHAARRAREQRLHARAGRRDRRSRDQTSSRVNRKRGRT